MYWRSATVAGLAGTVEPNLPATAVVAAVADDEGGYAVKLSDGCPLDGRFEIGSTAKTMTGMVLASLVAAGAVLLDDRIGRWLDAGRNSDITLLQLATHTAGLPRLAPGHTVGAAGPHAFLTAEPAERNLRLTPPGPRGVDWDYSNFGFQRVPVSGRRPGRAWRSRWPSRRSAPAAGTRCRPPCGPPSGSR